MHIWMTWEPFEHREKTLKLPILLWMYHAGRKTAERTFLFLAACMRQIVVKLYPYSLTLLQNGKEAIPDERFLFLTRSLSQTWWETFQSRRVAVKQFHKREGQNIMSCLNILSRSAEENERWAQNRRMKIQQSTNKITLYWTKMACLSTIKLLFSFFVSGKSADVTEMTVLNTSLYTNCQILSVYILTWTNLAIFKNHGSGWHYALTRMKIAVLSVKS